MIRHEKEKMGVPKLMRMSIGDGLKQLLAYIGRRQLISATVLAADGNEPSLQ